MRVGYYSFLIPIFGALTLMAADNVSPERQSILSVDDHYVQAFNAGDADRASRDFTTDAIYETDDGRTLKGRDAIRQDLAEQFKDAEGATLKLNVYAVDVAPDRQHATERGVSIVTEDGIQEPSSYVAEFARADGQWRVSRVVEKPQAASAEHLEPLAWMIGQWADQSEDATIRMNVEWSLDRGFITRKFAVSGEGLRDLRGIEYIGWDSVKKEIHSWYFDSDGGSGRGRWHREGNSWVEESSGATQNGEPAGATFIFTSKDQNSFGWRAIRRYVGDEKREDLPEIILHRTSSEQIQEQRGQL